MTASKSKTIRVEVRVRVSVRMRVRFRLRVRLRIGVRVRVGVWLSSDSILYPVEIMGHRPYMSITCPMSRHTANTKEENGRGSRGLRKDG